MKVDVLKEFTMLARNGSFRKTADSLFISQPTLSYHMRELEEEIGFKLIDRERKNKLTKAGSIFYSEISTLIQSLDEAILLCRSIQANENSSSHPIQISIYEGMQKCLEIEQLLNKAKVPYICKDRNYELPYFAEVARGTADFAVTYDCPLNRQEAEANGLTVIDFGSEAFGLVMDKANPLSEEGLTTQDLEGMTVLVEPYEYAPWKQSVMEMLGDCKDLSFSFISFDRNQLPQALNLEDSFVVANLSLCDHQIMNERGLIVIDEINGKPIFCKQILVYDAERISEEHLSTISYLKENLV